MNQNHAPKRGLGVGLMLAVLVTGLISLTGGAASTGTDDGWFCPGLSVKYDDLSGETYTVRSNSIDVWIKAGPDHYSFGPRGAGDVLAVEATTGHDASHAHECLPTSTTVPTILATTTVPDSTTTVPESTTTQAATTTTSTPEQATTTVPETTTSTPKQVTTTSTPPESTTTTIFGPCIPDAPGNYCYELPSTR